MKASYGDKHWTPPKGHVDPGENIEQTAFRETLEESGLEKSDLIVDSEFEHQIFYPVNGKMKKVVYFLAETKFPEKVTLSEEHTEFKWLDFNGCKEIFEKAGHDTLVETFMERFRV